jgi:hypothetical protein
VTNAPPTLTAIACDVDSPLLNVVAAEYFLNTAPSTKTRGTPLAASDGSFNSPTESVTGTLTAAEFAEMQTHTTLGAEYLAGIPELHPIIPIVRNHHERWDGTGYPDRLAREEIPLLARIVAVADAFDAMTSHRPYHENKRGRNPAFAFAEVEKQSGRQFDPACAAAFLAITAEVLEVKREVLPGTGSHVSIASVPPADHMPETHYGLVTPEELRVFDADAVLPVR